MDIGEQMMCDDLIRQLRQYKRDVTEFKKNHENQLFFQPNLKLSYVIDECDKLIWQLQKVKRE